MGSALFPDLVVNGEPVAQCLIAAEAQHHPAPRGKPGVAWRKAANALAMRVMLLQDARARGIAAQPKELAPGRLETEDEALIRALLDQAVAVAAPTEAEIRAEYDRDPSRFRAPPLWEASHILVASDPRDAAAKQAARERAAVLAAKARANPSGFARLACAESDCGSAKNGGALGQIRPGDTVPEFEVALRDLAEGETTADPVLTRHGWHVIRADAVATGAVLPFVAARDQIAMALEKRAWTQAARDFAQALVAKADISGADIGAE